MKPKLNVELTNACREYIEKHCHVPNMKVEDVKIIIKTSAVGVDHYIEKATATFVKVEKNVLVDGCIPPHTVCPYRDICELKTNCDHRGRSHTVKYSCA